MKHALVIEDQFLISFMIEDELRALGYGSVRTAHSAEAAIQLAEEQCPDLITVDENIDRGSGIAAIRHICRDKSIPAVFIVADGSVVRRQIPDAVILLKPFSDTALREAICGAKAVQLSST